MTGGQQDSGTNPQVLLQWLCLSVGLSAIQANHIRQGEDTETLFFACLF